MRKSLSIVASFAVVFVSLSAYADVDTSFNSKQVRFHMNTYKGDNMIDLSIGLEKHDGAVDFANVYMYQDNYDKTIVHVSENISGKVGITPTLTSTLSQGFSVNTLDTNVSEYVNTGFYDSNGGGGKGIALPDGIAPVVIPSRPDFWATGNASFSGSNFTLLNSQGNYGEYISTWNNVSTTYFNGYGNWSIQYPTVKIAEMAVYSVAVPEPSVLALGGLSSLGLLARRRKQV